MIIDGKQLAASLKEAMREEVQQLVARYGRRPGLAMIVVGDNPASLSYVRGKIKATEFCGLQGEMIHLEATASEQQVLSEIERLNGREDIDGILVQLPLPEQVDPHKVVAAIRADKDVDGFHPRNVASLWMNDTAAMPEGIIPCTPRGIIALLDKAGAELVGKRAVVVGRSQIVGKPIAKLLLDRQCTVTMAHSRTRDLGAVCREADILVVAAGRAHLITADMVKPGAVIIDVGINRTDEGRLVGDVDFEAVAPLAAAITPVPGGVGPMTITMLMRNTIDCYKRLEEQKR